MSVWLDGNMACEEPRRYVWDFLSAHRMRPVDDDASGADNSDDLLSDEELTLSSDSLLDATERPPRSLQLYRAPPAN